MKKILLLFCTLSMTVGTFAQTHTMEIHSNNRVASLLMTPTEYNNWIVNDEYNNSVVREALIQDVYQKFEDDFDFIFLVLNESVKPANLPYGQLLQVSNATSGLGMSIFDNTANYGSAGMLEALIHLPRLDYLRSGPSLHELMHNWGNFGIPTESVNALGSGLTSFAYIPHWGFTGGSSKGQLGGFSQNTLVDNGGGSYTVESFGGNANGGNSIPYNEMELYLMGMIPLSQVTDFDVFTTITSLADNGDGTYTFDAANRTTYNSAAITGLLGNRDPSTASSQKDFKGLIVVLTDTPLTTAEWVQIDSDAEKFSRTSSDGSSSYNFWEATNQLGTIDFGNLNASVGLNKLTLQNSLILYPNPATDIVNIKVTDEFIEIKDVKLINSNGQEISEVNTIFSTGNISIDLTNVNVGLYFVNITTVDNVVTTKKIIVQ